MNFRVPFEQIRQMLKMTLKIFEFEIFTLNFDILDKDFESAFWLQVTYSQPTNDLALLMISSLPSEIRRQYTTHLLDFYWQHFIDNTKKLNVEVERDLKYTKKELMEDYKNSQLLALLLCIGSIDVALKNSEIEKRLIDVLSDLHKDGVLSFEFVNGL